MSDKEALAAQAEELYKVFQEEILRRFTGADSELILKAFNFAKKIHEGQFRHSGAPYMTHCVETANILLKQVPDPAVVSAGLLHDVMEKSDPPLTVDDLKKEFPDPVPILVDGVTKVSEMSEIEYKSEVEKQVETYRKMFMAMAKDLRVILIKMADRLHNVRTIKFLPPDKLIKIAKQTLEIYAPLANRFGMAKLKSEFEDKCMEILYPYKFKEIKEELEKKRDYWEGLINELKEILGKLLEENGIKAEIQGRIKHIYSIYTKMNTQGLNVNEIYDLVAMRIITDSERDCYDTFGLVHGKWTPIQHRIKDFIHMPKENNYRSLHTTVILPSKDRVEIQIRTKDMHRIAEEGVAAHWRYKERFAAEKPEGAAADADFLSKFREWLDSQSLSSQEFMTSLVDDLCADKVFCFTPKGDIYELPKGSTPIDFAYSIHSSVGDRCVGARVNDKIVPLKYELHNEDIVEIITAKNAHPSTNWLEFVKTIRAKNKIRHFLKSLHFEKNVSLGREILMHALKAKGIAFNQAQEILRRHLSALRVNSFDELLAGIGRGIISGQQAMNRIAQEQQKSQKDKKDEASRAAEAEAEKAQKQPEPEIVVYKSGKKSKSEILVDNMPNALVRIALCCKPKHGEPIIGFVTKGKGVSVHKKDCPSFNKIVARGLEEEARIVKTEWNDGVADEIKTLTIRIVSYDRIGLTNDITSIITKKGLTIRNADISVNQRKSIATLRFELLTQHPQIVEELLAEILTDVKSVFKAEIVSKGKLNRKE